LRIRWWIRWCNGGRQSRRWRIEWNCDYVSRRVIDVALVDILSHQYVAVGTPTESPLVANDPITAVDRIGSVADQRDAVVDIVLRTRRIQENARRVSVESVVDENGNTQRAVNVERRHHFRVGCKTVRTDVRPAGNFCGSRRIRIELASSTLTSIGRSERIVSFGFYTSNLFNVVPRTHGPAPITAASSARSQLLLTQSY